MPREGSFATMIQTRNFELQLYGIALPAKVFVDGKEFPFAMASTENAWTYSGKDLTAHIHIPRMDCQHKMEIIIHLNEKNTNVDGVIGKMNRLREATLYLKNHWFEGSPLPDIIPGTDQAWLNINYHPENFDKIISDFHVNYDKIPQIINDSHVDALTKTKCSAYLK